MDTHKWFTGLLNPVKVLRFWILHLLLIIFLPNASSVSLIACDDEIAKLSCSGSELINISEVYYGRNDQYNCNSFKSKPISMTCQLQGALYTVRQKCENRGQCSFVVGRQTFDDPCPNANKYLRIIYECSPLHETCTGGIKSISSRVRYEQAKPAKVSAWMRDPLLQNPKIYQMAAVRFVSSNLWEYATPEKLRKGKADTFHHLPDTIAGTGFLVYDNHIYYNLEQTRKVVKISLYNQDKRVTAVLPQANYMNTSPYGDDTEFHYDTDIDLAVDEKGLWAIYATESNQGSIVVSKLDRHSLSVIRTYNTNYYKMSAINAFMTCGCLYVVNYTSLVIDYKFNTTSGRGEKINIPIPELTNQTTSISYNPKDHKLYVWDNDAILYDVEFQTLATTTQTSTTTQKPISRSTLASSTTTTTTKSSSDKNVHSSLSSTSPNKKPVIPSRQCPQTNISGLSWPATHYDTVAVLPCPGVSGEGEVFWKCGGNLEDIYWMDLPDFKQCTSSWLVKLKNSINKRNVKNRCDELIEEIEKNRNMMSSWDIIEVIDTLFVILKNAENDLPSAATLTSNFVEIASVLLDKDFKNLWQHLDVSMRRDTSERLAASLEHVAMLLFADVTSDNQRYDSKWSGPHVNLKLMVESVKSASKAVWETDSDMTFAFEEAKFGDLEDKDQIAFVCVRLENIGSFMEDSKGLGSRIYPVNSDVILLSAATVRSSDLKPQKVLLSSGRIKLRFSKHKSYEYNECAFWDIMSTDGQAYGKWSGNGCTTISNDLNQITCECNHMKSFALLSSNKVFPNSWYNESLSNQGRIQNEKKDSFKKSKVEYLVIIRVGTVFSIVLLAVVEILLSFYSMKLDENTINKNMILNVLITSVCFAGGIDQVQFKALCGVVAVILHFGILSSATWSAISCLHLLIADELVDQNRRWKRYYLMGYAIPTIIVIITSIANHQAYIQNEICWISSDQFTIYSVVIPLLAAILTSVACIVLVLKKLCYSTEFHHQSIKRKMLRVSTQKICLVNALLAGLWASLIPWMSGTQQEVTAWLSCIFSVLYGVACFLIYFVFDDEPRNKFNQWLHHFKKDDFTHNHTPHSNGRRRLVPPVTHRNSSGFPLVNHSLHSPQSCSEDSRPLPPAGTRSQTLNFTESQIGEQNCPLIGPSSAGSLPHDLTSCSASCCVCRSEGSDSKYHQNPHCSANSSNTTWNSYVQHQRTNSSGPIPKPTQVHHCINCNSTECSLTRKYDRKSTSTNNHFYEQPRHIPFCQCTQSSGTGSGCYDHLHEDMNQPRHGPIRRVRPGCHCRSMTTSSETNCPHPSHFYETLGSFRKSPQQQTEDSNLELFRQVTNPIQYSSDPSQTPQDPRFRQQQRHQYFDRASLSSSSAERQSNHSSSFDSRDSSQHLQRSSQQRRVPTSFQHRCDPRTIRTLPEDSRLCDADDLEEAKNRAKNTFTCNGSCRHPRNGRSSDPLSTDQGYDTDSQMQNRREKSPPRDDGSHRSELKRLIRPKTVDPRKENGSSDSENDLEVENIIRSSHVGDDDVMLSSPPPDEEVIDTEHGGFISPTDTVTSWAALGPDPSYGKPNGPNCKSMHAILVKRQYKNSVASVVSDERRNSSYVNGNEVPSSYTLPGTSDSATKARIDLRTGGVNMVTNL